MKISLLKLSSARKIGCRFWNVGPLVVWIRRIRSDPCSCARFQYAFLLEEVMIVVSRKDARIILRGIYLDRLLAWGPTGG